MEKQIDMLKMLENIQSRRRNYGEETEMKCYFKDCKEKKVQHYVRNTVLQIGMYSCIFHKPRGWIEEKGVKEGKQ